MNEVTKLTALELAQKYTKKIAELLEEFSRTEKEAPPEEREALYSAHQTRLVRVINNYEKKLDPDTGTTEEEILRAHNIIKVTE